MKKAQRWVACWAMMVALAASGCSNAPSKPFEKSEAHLVSATVESVDLATREVTVRGPDGPVSFVAGPEVRNLPAVRVGDEVTVRYYVGIAAQITKSAASVESEKGTISGSQAALGSKPGASIRRSLTSTVRILSVDTSFDTVTFRRADGGPRTIAVESVDGQAFIKTLKAGDLVDVTYTEALAVAVLPAR
jgi:hypothetical protein